MAREVKSAVEIRDEVSRRIHKGEEARDDGAVITVRLPTPLNRRRYGAERKQLVEGGIRQRSRIRKAGLTLREVCAVALGFVGLTSSAESRGHRLRGGRHRQAAPPDAACPAGAPASLTKRIASS